jgi:hypothetical protein
MRSRPHFALSAVAVLALAGCSLQMSKPAVKDPGADRVRAELRQLQADADLASRAPAAIKEAEAAVDAAEVPQSDPALGSHLVYLADRKVQTARALAEARQAEDRINALRSQPPAAAVSSSALHPGVPVVQVPQTVQPANPEVPVVDLPQTPPPPMPQTN